MRLAFSPCPNDTFIFYAWVHGLIAGTPEMEVVLADIDELNAMALCGETDVTKLSFAALAHVFDRYALLHAGGALGRGCGPLLVVGKEALWSRPEELVAAAIAIPGELTTAALLLRLRLPEARHIVVLRFDEIMPAVAEGKVDAGVIIHEGRFTYSGYGLRCLEDLGEWWEVATGLPIPLGGIAIKRDMSKHLAAKVDAALRAGVEYVRRHPEAARAYVRAHAQEMDERVCQEHIALYVNEFSLDYGNEGRRAIEELFSRAESAGVMVATGATVGTMDTATLSLGLFWDE